MGVEIKVVTKPGESLLEALVTRSGNLPLWSDQILKGATPILTVAEFVTLVVNTATSKKTTVDFIQINGHGNTKGFDIGNEWIDATSLTKFRPELAKVAPHLSKKARVEVSACKAGNAKEVMREFSQILGGATIVGYLIEQIGGMPGVGPPVVVTPGGAFVPAAPAAGASAAPPPPPK
jgi:hypothetical protein